jgi:hypothetical protein
MVTVRSPPLKCRDVDALLSSGLGFRASAHFPLRLVQLGDPITLTAAGHWQLMLGSVARCQVPSRQKPPVGGK